MKTLPKVVTKRAKRVGRGRGSGKGGHTVGRGVKGQGARSKISIMFEGFKVKKSLLRRLPLKRGKNKFYARPRPVIIKIDYLNLMPAGAKVNVDSLVKAGIVKKDEIDALGVKILGGGELQKKLIVEVPTSRRARSQIEKAGGKIV